MLRVWYLRRAVPWGAVIGFLAPAAALVAAVEVWESFAGLGLPLAAVMSASAVAFLYDDAAAAVTAVTPRGGRWARASRALLAVAPVGVGVALLTYAAGRLGGDRSDWALVVGGLGALVLLSALTCDRRQVPRPGGAIASAVVLVGMVPLVLGVFFDVGSPYPVTELADGLRGVWAMTLGCALVAAVALLLLGGRP